MEPQDHIALLLDCLHLDPGRVDAPRLAALTEADWEHLVALATEQCVRSLFYHRLKSCGLDGVVPDKIRQALKDFYYHNAVRNMRLYGELKCIVAAFEEFGIPIIALKGIHLAAEAYANIALREMGDMDILVPRQHLQRAAELMSALDYEPTRPYSIDVDVAVSQHLTKLIKKGVGIVEIHWTITKPGQHYTIAVDELWERAVPIQIVGIDVWGLCPEDLLLHLCCHTSYQHQFSIGLRNTCDVAQVIRHYGERIDWIEIQKRTQRWGWERGIYLALRVAKEFSGAAVPETTLDALKPGEFTEDLVTTAKTQIFTEREFSTSLPRKLAQTWGQSSAIARMRELVKSIVIPKVSLAKQYSVSPDSPLIYRYYLVRLKDLLARYSLKAWQLQQGDPRLTQLAGQTRDLSEWLSDT